MTNSPEATTPDSSPARPLTQLTGRRLPARPGRRRLADAARLGHVRPARRAALGEPARRSSDGVWHQISRKYVWVQLISTGSFLADRRRRDARAHPRGCTRWWAWIPGGILTVHPGVDARDPAPPGARDRLPAARGRPRLPSRHPVAAPRRGALRPDAARRHHPRPARPRLRHRAAEVRHRGRLDRRHDPRPRAGRRPRRCATTSSPSPRAAGRAYDRCRSPPQGPPPDRRPPSASAAAQHSAAAGARALAAERRRVAPAAPAHAAAARRAVPRRHRRHRDREPARPAASSSSCPGSRPTSTPRTSRSSRARRSDRLRHREQPVPRRGARACSASCSC